MTKPLNPLVQQNLLDKAIAYVAPKVAAQRMAARAQLALAGGYTGAKFDRASLNRWKPFGGSANADIIGDLPTLRARSRDQMRNAPVALGALNTATSHVVGTGPDFTRLLSMLNFSGLDDTEAEQWQEDTQRRFKAWGRFGGLRHCASPQFYGLQELAFRSMLESGDTFVLTPRITRAGSPARLALQLIEADRVCNPNRTGDTDTLIDGVEIAATTGEAIAYHVSRKHPGDLRTTGNQWDRVVVRGSSTGRRNVLHLFKPLRPGQVRGVPWIAPILEPLKQLNRYTDAELNAAVISGLYSASSSRWIPRRSTRCSREDCARTPSSRTPAIGAAKWSPAKSVNLLPGESVERAVNPGRPNAQFDPFWQAIVRQIGMALELPFEVLTMHFQSSYSAARAAHADGVERFPLTPRHARHLPLPTRVRTLACWTKSPKAASVRRDFFLATWCALRGAARSGRATGRAASIRSRKSTLRNGASILASAPSKRKAFCTTASTGSKSMRTARQGNQRGKRSGHLFPACGHACAAVQHIQARRSTHFMKQPPEKLILKVVSNCPCFLTLQNLYSHRNSTLMPHMKILDILSAPLGD
jgi:lambda family phage portal protein